MTLYARLRAVQGLIDAKRELDKVLRAILGEGGLSEGSQPPSGYSHRHDALFTRFVERSRVQASAESEHARIRQLIASACTEGLIEADTAAKLLGGG